MAANGKADPAPGLESGDGDGENGPEYSEAEFLEDILHHNGGGGLTADKLLSLDGEALLRYSFLVLAYITAETEHGIDGDVDGGDPRFADLLRAFCARAAESRPLKLRMALLTQVADLGASEIWHPTVLYDPDSYEQEDDTMLEEDDEDDEEERAPQQPVPRPRSDAANAEAVAPTTGTATGTASSGAANRATMARKNMLRVSADELLNDSTSRLLVEYTQRRFFHPKNGITLKTKRNWRHSCGLRTVKDAFSEYSALLFLMQDLNLGISAEDKEKASAVGLRMERLELIERASVSTSSCLPGMKSSSSNREFGEGPRFGFRRNVFVRGPESAFARSRFGSPQRRQQGSVRSSSVVAVPTSSKSLVSVDADAGNGAAADVTTGINVTFRLDVIDMQSINFWRRMLWSNPLVEGSDFGTFAVVHPMSCSTREQEMSASFSSSSTLAARDGGFVVHRVGVKKVFSSMAKPGILSLSAYPPGSVCCQYVPKEDELKFTNLVEILPRVIAKTGDNLINDMSVELMFRVFNHVWRQDVERFGGADKAPFSYAYDVLPTGPKAGLLEVVTNIEPLNDYDWTAWMSKNKEKPEVLDTMLRSAAGCSVATYILGCGDRHWDNILIKDGHTLMHIDFGMILGKNPAFKTPRFSISAQMEEAFKDCGIWNRFLKMCGDAFLSLRDRSAELTRVTALALNHAGRPRAAILKFLASEASFNVSENDHNVALKYVVNQVEESSSHWETILRKFTHDKVDPVFFKMAEAAPASLVAAVEKMY